MDEASRRARGAYYTPAATARYLARWLVRRESDRYLEPSFGGGVFLEAVNDLCRGQGWRPPDWLAAEADPAAIAAAIDRGLISPEQARLGDFLALPPTPREAVIANPPYVRLRHLPAGAREQALATARSHLGEAMSPAGSLWMAFLAHMTAFLVPGGRLAAVLPLDFSYVAYARPLWRHLAASFGSLSVLHCRERLFPDLDQDVLLLLADQAGGSTSNIAYQPFETTADLLATPPTTPAHARTIAVADLLAGRRAFQAALLPPGLTESLDKAEAAGEILPAGQLAQFHIGYVAGNKSYFHPTAVVVQKFGLPAEHLVACLNQARQLRGQGLWTSTLAERAPRLWLPAGELTVGEQAYRAMGEAAGTDRGYKTSHRRPWWRVPDVRVPDALATVFSDQPSLVINDAGLAVSNSLLAAYLRPGWTAEALAEAWYTPLTRLMLALEVHHLGGGVMILVPQEAAALKLLRPSGGTRDLPILADSPASSLGQETTLARIDQALRQGKIDAAYDAGAPALRQRLGSEVLELIDTGYQTLNRWRQHSTAG